MLERKNPFSKKPRPLPYFGPVNFRHALSGDSTEAVQRIVDSVRNEFDGVAHPLTHPNSPGKFIVSDGVTVLSDRGLPIEVRGNHIEQPYMIKALLRKVVYEACHAKLLKEALEVQLGRFIVSRQTKERPDAMLVATITLRSGEPLTAEHGVLSEAYRGFGMGDDLVWPPYRPHLTIAALRFPVEDTGTILAKAEKLTDDMFATPIILQPLEEW